MQALQYGRQKMAHLRRAPDATQETWLIHYDDIRFGNIVMQQRIGRVASRLQEVGHCVSG